MTQIGEGVLPGFITEFEAKYKCSHEEDKTQWKCNLEGETAGHLTENIPTCYEEEPEWPPSTGKPNLGNCTKTTWPSQAHHLIPWKQLKAHKTAHYLAKNKNKLVDNNHYSVNHGNNGYFMPFASNITDWDSASEIKKQKIAIALMDVTGIQLHQSKHSYEAYECAEQGYKEAVNKYLNIILNEALIHYDICEQCKSKKQGNKVPPRMAVVRFVDRASQILKSDIMNKRIFVSKRAAQWACKK
jgi:hypothetical protein